MASVALVLTTRPRPHSSLLFFGCVLLAFGVDESAQLRLLVVTSAASGVFLAETLVRRLPKTQIIAAVCAMFVAVGYYFLLLFGIAAGGV